jgi:hypothetical protein
LLDGAAVGAAGVHVTLHTLAAQLANYAFGDGSIVQDFSLLTPDVNLLTHDFSQSLYDGICTTKGDM